jgi:hypothetical protein
VSTSDGLSPGGILALLEDREGSLWVGTTLGLTQVTLGPAVTYGSRAGLRDPELLTLAAGPGGHGILVATARGSLSLFDGSRFQSLGRDLPFAGSRILSLLVEGDLLWVGTDKGLYLREGGRWGREWQGQALPRESVRSLLRSGDGFLWVGTEGAGLFGLRNGALRSFTRRDGLPSDQVRGLLERRDGSLLVATYGGVGELRSPEGPVFSLPGLHGVMARSLHEDVSGVLWVGTYGEGLLRVARGAVTAVTTREGLLSDVVYAILEEGPRLWLSCNRGLFAVAKSEVEAFARGDAARVTSEVYGREDGMASEDCSGGFPSGLQDAQGRLFFPTGAGLVAFDPARRTAGRAAPIPLFEEALVAGRRASLSGRLRVPPGGPRFEVRYTSVAFQAAERTIFSYRLRGFETEWTDADRRRFATYTNVPAGQYQLEVRARTEGSDWQRADPPLEVVVEAHWHARPEVQAGAAVLLVLALVLGYAARIRGLARREAELRERVDQEVARLKVLRGLLPICAGCKKIREGDGYWRQIEAYIRENSEADFSHGMCPDCVSEWFPASTRASLT